MKLKHLVSFSPVFKEKSQIDSFLYRFQHRLRVWSSTFVFVFFFFCLQIQSVTEEKKRLKTDLEEAYKRHKEELEIQQLQHFQTFRNYREVFEDQKSAIEQRYRALLEEAIQDAVFLSTRNQELMHENQALKQGNCLRALVTKIIRELKKGWR